MKPIKIGTMETAVEAYQNQKLRKTKTLEQAFNLCSKIITISDCDSFQDNFEAYTYKVHKEKINLPYIERAEWRKICGLDFSELNQLQKRFDLYSNISLKEKAKDPDFDIYITTEIQKKVYDQLLKICDILNSEPDYIQHYFNASNQFSRCILLENKKAIINNIWLINLC